MTKPVCVQVLAGAMALAFCGAPFAAGEAWARVGVTSATDGDPLGKPPQEAERVLRIGVDVQANEVITTDANDRAHLLFLDGSSLTVGPNAQLVIDKFVFDPNTKTGELAINASRGVLRLVGGKISKTAPIVVTTPANTVGIRGGITIMDVKASQTDSTFVFGKDMTVTAAGQTQTATRPGSMIVTNLGSAPGLPTILAQGALAGQLRALEGRPATQGGGGGGSSSGGRNADNVAQSSGLSGANSSQPVRIVAPGVPDNFGSGPGPSNRNPNDTIATALSNANQATQTDAARQVETQSQAFTLPEHDKVDLGFFDFQKLGLDFAGRITTVSELANLNQQRATATYNGQIQAFANGNFNNSIGGTYTNVWSFGNRNGVATIRLDNSTYGGGSAPNTFLSGNGPFFSSNGTIAATGGPAGRSVAVEGVFVSTPSGGAAKQQVGVISATGPNNYNAIGAFVGTR